MPTGNTDRIRVELEKAAAQIAETFPGYREALIEAALNCITDTAEHDDRRLNINQRFDSHVEMIARRIVAGQEAPA